jgi:uncharacterized protein (TIGR00725 family)
MEVPRRSLIAVIGPGEASATEEEAAHAVGAGLARGGWSLVCGGLGGVMAAAARGHRTAPRPAGVVALGILPGQDPSTANDWVDIALPTGLGEGRNLLVVRAARAVVAVGGAYGTLSEIALALRAGTPVIGIRTWELARGGRPDPGIVVAADPQEAVEHVARALAAD